MAVIRYSESPVALRPAARRARVTLQYKEQVDVLPAYPVRFEPVKTTREGWAEIDGSWLHCLDDDDTHWTSWPIQSVLCVEWDERLGVKK